MLLSEAKWIFMCFILWIPGTPGKEISICVLKGSSANLTCPNEHSAADMRWYIFRGNDSTLVLKELSVDRKDVSYSINEDGNFILTINDVRESDENLYCCKESTDEPELCWNNTIKLHVADLQVKVFPGTEGKTVTLMCSASCPLTENPSAFIWYKNQQFLYEDWSPWYRELVSSEKAVKYSCAVNGHQDLRAPEVSVDSVTSTCFRVTYAEGRMCSHELKPVNEPCSITYPRDVHLQMTSEKYFVTMTCNTSCPAADPQTAFKWYRNRNTFSNCKDRDITVFGPFAEIFSCAVKSNEHLHSDEICTDTIACCKVNYICRRFCALEGSSVNISSIYFQSEFCQSSSKLWFKILRSVEKGKGAFVEVEAVRPVEYHDKKNQHTLTINDLKMNDSGEYMFSLQRSDKNSEQLDSLGVMLVVTGLKVTMFPSAVVTEGQRVTLTCTTSCPLMDNTAYIWYFNSHPLSMSENQNKHLYLDPVRSLHAGNYSCAVATPQNISSPEESLTVKALGNAVAVLNILKLVVLFLISLFSIVACLMIRKRKL